MFKQFILGIVRHSLTYGGGILTAKGWGDSGDWDQAIGAIITLVGIAWSIWDKRRSATVPGGSFNPRAEVRRPAPSSPNGGYVRWELLFVAVLLSIFWSAVFWLACHIR